MHLLALAASVLGIEVDELLEHLKNNAMAWSTVALFALIGFAFLLVALNAWLTTLWGPIVSPLVIGAAALVIAGGIWGAIAITDSIAKRRATQRRNAAEKTALVTTAALTFTSASSSSNPSSSTCGPTATPAPSTKTSPTASSTTSSPPPTPAGSK